MILIDADGLTATRPGRPLFRDASITVSTGDRIGVVGINGTGKSTLLGMLAGTVDPEAGSVRRGRGTRVEMLDQNPDLGSGTVADHVGSGWEVAAVLDRLGVSALVDTPVAHLSGGQIKRVALAHALVAESDVLLLDEPTNHLDIDAIAWLEDRLNAYRGALVVVTHDRHLLDSVTNRVLELDRGRTYTHEGGYDAYLDAKANREAAAATAEQVRRNQARTELAWLRRGAPARTSKPKARIEAAERLIAQRPDGPARAGELPLHGETPRLGDIVIELDDVGHRFPGGDWLFRHVELRLDPRERLGIVGPNGAGKSTLLQILAGRIVPEEGTRNLGSTAAVAYIDQMGELDPRLKAWQVVVGPDGVHDWRSKALMEAFWFDADAQWAEVRWLSGGEQRRLQLLHTLASQPNVLLLDEPTNDLDLDTLRSLEEFLETFPGAVVAISHDRAFLERVVADVIVVDGQGKAARRPGGYARWEADRHLRRAPRRASRTKRPGEPKSRSSTGPSPSTLRRTLADAEKRLKAAERRRDTIVETMSSLAASGDHERLSSMAAEHDEAVAAVRTIEAEWMDVAEQAEAAGVDL